KMTPEPRNWSLRSLAFKALAFGKPSASIWSGEHRFADLAVQVSFAHKLANVLSVCCKPIRQSRLLLGVQLTIEVTVDQLPPLFHGETLGNFILRSMHSRSEARVRLNITRTATTARPSRMAMAFGLSD